MGSARAGRRVALLERGPFPGSKNVYGGVVYARVLDDVLPRWWERVQRCSIPNHRASRVWRPAAGTGWRSRCFR